jgi:hypothetical protein
MLSNPIITGLIGLFLGATVGYVAFGLCAALRDSRDDYPPPDEE